MIDDDEMLILCLILLLLYCICKWNSFPNLIDSLNPMKNYCSSCCYGKKPRTWRQGIWTPSVNHGNWEIVGIQICHSDRTYQSKSGSCVIWRTWWFEGKFGILDYSRVPNKRACWKFHSFLDLFLSYIVLFFYYITVNKKKTCRSGLSFLISKFGINKIYQANKCLFARTCLYHHIYSGLHFYSDLYSNLFKCPYFINPDVKGFWQPYMLKASYKIILAPGRQISGYPIRNIYF